MALSGKLVFVSLALLVVMSVAMALVLAVEVNPLSAKLLMDVADDIGSSGPRCQEGQAYPFSIKYSPRTGRLMLLIRISQARSGALIWHVGDALNSASNPIPLGDKAYLERSYVDSHAHWCNYVSANGFIDLTMFNLAISGTLVSMVAGLSLKLMRGGRKGMATLLAESVVEDKERVRGR